MYSLVSLTINGWNPPKKHPFDPPIGMPTEPPPHMPDDDDDPDDWDYYHGY